MKPSKLYKDNTLELRPDHTWDEAVNILYDKGYQSIRPEPGTTFNCSVPNLQLCGVIEIQDRTIILAQNTVSLNFVIYSHTDGIMTKILDTQYIRFTRFNPIEGVFFYRATQECTIIFTDSTQRLGTTPDTNGLCILNIDNLPFEVDANKELLDGTHIDRMKAFPNIKHVNYEIDKEDNNGSIKAGVHQLFVQYKIADGLYTNYTLPSNPIPVGELNLDDSLVNVGWSAAGYLPFNKSKGGELVNKGFNISISNLSTQYSKFRVGVLTNTGTTTESNLIGEFDINSSTEIIRFDGKYENETISAKDLLIGSTIIKNPKTLTSIQNRLYIGNFEIPNTRVNYQQYANAIVVNYDYDTVDIGGTAGNQNGYHAIDEYYGTSKACLELRGVRPNEVYALYIHLLFKDGSISDGFHIPGRPVAQYDFTTDDCLENELISSVITLGKVVVGDNEYSDYINAGHAAITLSQSHWILDTSNNPNAVDIKGNPNNMGYYENINEIYVDNEDAIIKDSTGILGTLAGENVRHHRMPSIDSVYGITNTMERVINLNFSNIYIPPELEDDVVGFTFSFAERTTENKSIHSSGLCKTSDWNIVPLFTPYTTPAVAKVFDIEVLSEYPKININLLKFYGLIDSPITLTPTLALAHSFEKKLNVIYRNNSFIGSIGDTYYNARATYGREYNLMITGLNENSYAGAVMRLEDMLYVAGNQIPLADSVEVKDDLYTSFKEQRLSLIGKVFNIAGTGTYSASSVYGFDTYLIQHSSVLRIPSPGAGTQNVLFSYPQYCSYNFIYRNKFNNDDTYAAYISYLATGVPPGSIPGNGYRANCYEYNKTNIRINNIKTISPFDREDNFIYKFPYTIRRSSIYRLESDTLPFNKFLPDEYYDHVRDRGEIWKLDNNGLQLLINFRYGLFITENKQEVTTSGLTANLGEPDIFKYQPKELIYTRDGYVGTISQFGCKYVDGGYFITDIENKTLWYYNGETIEDYSDSVKFGMDKYLDEVLGKEELLNIDNPFLTGVTVIQDRENKRILLNIKSLDEEANLTYKTLSIIPGQGIISEHTYNPSIYFRSRKGLYSAQFLSTLEIYKHNVGAKGVYYNSNINASYVDIVINPIQGNKIFESINWRTTTKEGDIVNHNKTITQLCVRTANKCTGLMDIELKSFPLQGNTSRVNERFYLNTFRDMIINHALPFLDTNKYPNANVDNSGAVVPFYERAKFIDEYIVIRVQFDNLENLDIYLNDLQTKYSQLTK